MNRIPWLAAGVFGLWCVLFCWSGAGLQYDEAYSVRGAAVLVAGSPQCAPASALKFAGRCWPLMVAPYVGASKDYIAAPLFALFGIRVTVARLTAALLGTLCILGFSIFLRDQVSPAGGALTAAVLCINPAFLDQILFDAGNVAMSMGLAGVAAVAGSRFLKSGHMRWSFGFGLTLGIAVWSRLNFSWLILSVGLGALVAFRSEVFRRPKALSFAASGFLLGAGPLAFFHWRDPSALRGYMKGNETYHNTIEFVGVLSYRLRMFAEIFFSDVEHRAIWTTQPAFGRIVWVTGALALAAVAWCLPRRESGLAASRWMRCFAFASLLLTAILLTTRMPVAEHHLVILIPFVIACVVTFLQAMWNRGGLQAWLVGAVATVYALSAIALQIRAISALHSTGGIGEYSDAIGLVYRAVDADGPRVRASILDWGLEANIFFLSKTTLSPAEIFWGDTRRKSSRGVAWPDEVAQGGLFLTNPSSRRIFPQATAAFEQALANSKLPYTVQQFNQRDGTPYAELYRVSPTRNP